MHNMAARIRTLCAQGRAAKAIAIELYGEATQTATQTRMAYVRAVRARALAGGMRPCDKEWNESPERKRQRAAYDRRRYQEGRTWQQRRRAALP